MQVWISPDGMSRARGTGIERDLVALSKNYLSHFSPSFLFFRGSTRIPENPARFGELYAFEIVSVTATVYSLMRSSARASRILLLWLLLYPLPAIVAGEASPQRSIIGAPIFTILSSLGMLKIAAWCNLKTGEKILKYMVMFVLFFPVFFGCKYFLAYPVDAAKLWNYGIGEAVEFAEQQRQEYSRTIMSSDIDSACFAISDFLGAVPFYTQYSPLSYQASPVPPWVQNSREKVYDLGDYTLLSLSRQRLLDTSALYLIRPSEVAVIEKLSYVWEEVESIKDSRGIEYWKLVKVSENLDL
jgi:hypothetical protein